MSSQGETIFGDFLEGLAIFIAGRVNGGHKSAAVGVDLEFTRDDIQYLVAIKSGPNWGNSSQIARMRDSFATAKRVLNTNRRAGNVVAVNGCCYGRDNQPDKGDYLKYCGQRFWEFISGDAELYVNIIEPLGHQAREKNEAFEQGYARVINLFSAEFMRDFAPSGDIDWRRLVKLGSAAVIDAREAALSWAHRLRRPRAISPALDRTTFGVSPPPGDARLRSCDGQVQFG